MCVGLYVPLVHVTVYVMCVSVCLCIYIMYVCMHGCVFCVHACMYVCMYVCTNVCMYVRMCVRTYVCMYVRMYVCMYLINTKEWLPTDRRDSKRRVRLVPYQTPCRAGSILIDFQEALSSKDLCRGSGCKIS